MTSIAGSPAANAASAHGSYEDLTALFSEWREFEPATLRDGAPDYTATALARKQTQLKSFQARLQAIKPDAWPIPQQVDYHLLRAEMQRIADEEDGEAAVAGRADAGRRLEGTKERV